MTIRVLFWSALLLLSAASWLGEANAQEDGQSRVRFALTTQSGWSDAEVKLFGAEDCGDERRLTHLYDHFFLRRPPRRRLEMPLWDYHENGANEFWLSADQRLHAIVIGNITQVGGIPVFADFSCAVVIDAGLEAAKDYEFVFTHEGSGPCHVTQNELVQTENGAERLLVESFSSGSMSQRCERSFRRIRWF